MLQRKQEHITSLDKGNYKARPVKIFQFERIPDAHRLMEANSANGKIVVVRQARDSPTGCIFHREMFYGW
jgi:hypothetical protein